MGLPSPHGVVDHKSTRVKEAEVVIIVQISVSMMETVLETVSVRQPYLLVLWVLYKRALKTLCEKG